MLNNAYLLAKIGADTAENKRNFAENKFKLATTLRVACAATAHWTLRLAQEAGEERWRAPRKHAAAGPPRSRAGGARGTGA